MANRSSLNDTEVEQDVEERDRKLREVQAMLREMRHRSHMGQMKLAERERMEAEKCKKAQHETQLDLNQGYSTIFLRGPILLEGCALWSGRTLISCYHSIHSISVQWQITVEKYLNY